MKAEEITKGSTLLATLNGENFPFGMHKDLIDDLHRMINIALDTPVVSNSEADVCACGRFIELVDNFQCKRCQAESSETKAN